MSTRPNYLIHAARWDPQSGGGIFLHMLCHTLRQLGEDAMIWPWYRSPRRGPLARLGDIIRKPRLLVGGDRQFLNPQLDTAIATRGDFRNNSIVVYPEVRLGNPMGAKNVVRWLLYKPGAENPYRFTDNEMFFRVGEICDMPEITGGAQDLVMWRKDPAYRNEQRPERKGACFLVRKGHEKARIPETADAIQIDGKSHEEIAEIFNACETFYSYDEASFYSQYAAICGCDSVVIPGMYASREDWTAEHQISRYGVAYGLNDIEHARATRNLLEGLLSEKEAEGIESVKAFIAATQDRFG